MSGKGFSVWLNNEYIPNNPDKAWIKEAYSKAVKRSIEDGCTAFTRFFKHQSDFPKFKKKGKSDVKMYFVRNNPKDCVCERHRLKIPTLGWVRIKEKGYIPTTKDGYVIKSGTVSIKADRYYVSVLVELPDNKTADNSNEGIGIDLGLKDFATVSNGKTYKNINKSAKLKKLEKQLIREQRSLSRKYENLQKGESTQRANIQKQKFKVQKLHHRIDHIRTDYINKTIAEIVKTKPSYITIEDLNVKGMMKNRHLSKAVASQKFYEFRIKLQAKCNENGMELRVANRWYPSSKTCHCCKNIRKDLKLSDRMHHYFGDIRDKEKVNSHIQEIKPDFIFHLAAQAIVSTSYVDPFDTITTNVVGTASVLEAIRNITWNCTSVLITSDKAYDNVEWIWGYRETDAV